MTDRDAVPFEDAVAAIAGACAPLAAETVALEAAAGRVLAHDLVAADDLIPFARSAMDGFALRAADARERRTFPVRGRAYAESSPARTVDAGTVTAVATGAPIPHGADAVVPFEAVVERDGAIELAAAYAVRPGDHVFPPGDDARRGDVLARAGDVLRAPALALLAAAGHARFEVVRRPRASIVTSGAEIVPVWAHPAFGEIRNSNATAVAAALAAFGADVVSVAHVGDGRADLQRAIASAAAGADLVVTTGGASVGERDHVKAVLGELGAAFAFRSVAMRPGRPSACATLGTAAILALPGNPAAVTVTLHELVRVAALRLGGRRELRAPRLTVRLRGAIHAKGDRTYFAFASLGIDADGRVEALPLNDQCSALTRTSADASGFVVLSPRSADVREGDRVAFDVIDWSGVRVSVRAT